MPRTDVIHNAVKNALVRDGWAITDDPLVIEFGSERIGDAPDDDRLFIARRGDVKLIIQVSSFLGVSQLSDLFSMLGRHQILKEYLQGRMPDHQIVVAARDQIHRDLLSDDAIQTVIQEHSVPLLVFNFRDERVVAWRQSIF